MGKWSMTRAVDDLLEKYSLARDDAVAFIDASVRLHRAEIADATALTQQTVNRYRNAFADMTAGERAFLIASLFRDWQAVVEQQS